MVTTMDRVRRQVHARDVEEVRREGSRAVEGGDPAAASSARGSGADVTAIDRAGLARRPSVTVNPRDSRPGTPMLARLGITAGLVLLSGSVAKSQQARADAGSECQASGGNPTPRGPALSEPAARAIVGPWYSLFTIPGRRDVRSVFAEVMAPDFIGCTGDRPGESRDREATVHLLEGLATQVPDMRFEIKELFVAGDRVIVRGEATGTPAADFLGTPHTGRQFRIMTIDILTIRNGRIAKTYHLENWLGALQQLRI